MKLDLNSTSPTASVDSPPSISVLMAVRNGEPFLDEAIASILSQSFTDLELIVVDNGSSDGTPSMLAAWAEKDSRLHCFHLLQPGLARSLNYAAAMARAPILARLDADDIAEPGRLARQYAFLQADKTIGAVGSHAWFINSRGRILGEMRPPSGREAVRAYLATGNPFVHSSVLMRRNLFEQVGGYREGLRYTEDLDLWLRLAEVTDLDVVPDLLVRYRQHRRSMMGSTRHRMALSETCARAAVVARQNGTEEPFADGRPQLRNALHLLGIDRSDFRKSFTESQMRLKVEVFYLMLPFPWRLKPPLRRLPQLLGLKPVFGWLLARLQRVRV